WRLPATGAGVRRPAAAGCLAPHAHHGHARTRRATGAAAQAGADQGIAGSGRTRQALATGDGGPAARDMRGHGCADAGGSRLRLYRIRLAGRLSDGSIAGRQWRPGHASNGVQCHFFITSRQAHRSVGRLLHHPQVRFVLLVCFQEKDMQLLFPACLISIVVLWGVLSPATLGSVSHLAMSSITKNFGWLYLWVVLGLVLFSVFLALSRYGDLKLGKEDEDPAFSLPSWFAMLF